MRKKYKNHKDSIASESYTKYKNKATKRKMSFNIDRNYFIKLVQQPCYYCGHFGFNKGDVNGCDRINSDIGYEIGNVVPCCRVCNSAKGQLSRDIFEKKLREWVIVAHNFLEGNI